MLYNVHAWRSMCGSCLAALLAALDLAVDILGVDASWCAEGRWTSIAGGRGAGRSILHRTAWLVSRELTAVQACSVLL